MVRHKGSTCWPVASFEAVKASPKLILFLDEGGPAEMSIDQEQYDWLTGRKEGGVRLMPASRWFWPEAVIQPVTAVYDPSRRQECRR